MFKCGRGWDEMWGRGMGDCEMCNGVEKCGVASRVEQRWGRLGSIERGYCLEEGHLRLG
jgi:hypothetical protein